MQHVLDFLRDVAANNNREWFAAHRAEYEASEITYRTLAEQLLDGISTFDDSVRGLTYKDCIYRIYRDTRFSTDKSPYKTWKGIYIVHRGKKSGYAGYYLHIEPEASMLYAGLHLPHPTVLRSVREEIIDNGDALMKAVHAAKGFSLCRDNALKRNPKGFPPGHKYDELLRLRDFGIMKPLSDEQMTSSELLLTALESFRSAQPLVEQLNRAVEYAYEEMM